MTTFARRLMTWGMGATLFLMGIAALVVAHVILAAAGSLPGACSGDSASPVACS